MSNYAYIIYRSECFNCTIIAPYYSRMISTKGDVSMICWYTIGWLRWGLFTGRGQRNKSKVKYRNVLHYSLPAMVRKINKTPTITTQKVSKLERRRRRSIRVQVQCNFHFSILVIIVFVKNFKSFADNFQTHKHLMVAGWKMKDVSIGKWSLLQMSNVHHHIMNW